MQMRRLYLRETTRIETSCAVIRFNVVFTIPIDLMRARRFMIIQWIEQKIERARRER